MCTIYGTYEAFLVKGLSCKAGDDTQRATVLSFGQGLAQCSLS